MATQAEIAELTAASEVVTTAAISELVAQWRTFDLSNPVGVRTSLAEYLPLIVEVFGGAMATMASDWYDAARSAVDAPDDYAAQPAETVPDAVLVALAGYATSALYAPTQPVDVLGEVVYLTTGPAMPDKALIRAAGGLQRHLNNAARDTLEGNAALDPARPRFARHASANACAFCRMLAQREPAYASQEAAERIVGRHGRQRGNRTLGQKYHDNCRCIGVPVFPGEKYEPAPYVADWRREYAEAREFDSKGRIDLKATLSTWRSEYAAR